jgi:hypothetical protein
MPAQEVKQEIWEEPTNHHGKRTPLKCTESRTACGSRQMTVRLWSGVGGIEIAVDRGRREVDLLLIPIVEYFRQVVSTYRATHIDIR